MSHVVYDTIQHGIGLRVKKVGKAPYFSPENNGSSMVGTDIIPFVSIRVGHNGEPCGHRERYF